MTSPLVVWFCMPNAYITRINQLNCFVFYLELQILVFGVSVNTTKENTPFHQKYCSACKPGINKMLMAIRTSLVNTEKPDILWMTHVPFNDWEVRGQIIGVGDKLITYLSDGNSGTIAAFK